MEARISHCPCCSDVVSWRRKGDNIVFKNHVATESGFECEANKYEFDESSIRAVAKDGAAQGRSKARGSRRGKTKSS